MDVVSGVLPGRPAKSTGFSVLLGQGARQDGMPGRPAKSTGFSVLLGQGARQDVEDRNQKPAAEETGEYFLCLFFTSYFHH